MDVNLKTFRPGQAVKKGNSGVIINVFDSRWLALNNTVLSPYNVCVSGRNWCIKQYFREVLVSRQFWDFKNIHGLLHILPSLHHFSLNKYLSTAIYCIISLSASERENILSARHAMLGLESSRGTLRRDRNYRRPAVCLLTRRPNLLGYRSQCDTPPKKTLALPLNFSSYTQPWQLSAGYQSRLRASPPLTGWLVPH